LGYFDKTRHYVVSVMLMEHNGTSQLENKIGGAVMGHNNSANRFSRLDTVTDRHQTQHWLGGCTDNAPLPSPGSTNAGVTVAVFFLCWCWPYTVVSRGCENNSAVQLLTAATAAVLSGLTEVETEPATDERPTRRASAANHNSTHRQHFSVVN